MAALMVYDSTKVLLRGILLSLETAGPVRWDDQIETADQCSYEMHQMAHSPQKSGRADLAGRAFALPQPAERAARAIPHVKSMVRAIRRRDQVAAVESGKAALAEM